DLVGGDSGSYDADDDQPPVFLAGHDTQNSGDHRADKRGDGFSFGQDRKHGVLLFDGGDFEIADLQALTAAGGTQAHTVTLRYVHVGDERVGRVALACGVQVEAEGRVDGTV